MSLEEDFDITKMTIAQNTNSPFIVKDPDIVLL